LSSLIRNHDKEKKELRKTMQKRFEEMMELYNELKQEIRHKDKHLYERWKAGGFIVDEDIVSMYPHMGEVVESLDCEDDEYCFECGEEVSVCACDS
jgi:hypothetical protein